VSLSYVFGKEGNYMKIGVVSDTHGGVDSWREVVRMLSKVDFILHAGDILNHGPLNPLPKGHNPKRLIEEINTHPIPILVAKGNCDSEVDEVLLKVIIQSSIFLQDGELRIFVHHGHTHNDEGRVELGKRYNFSLIISGHTHSPKIEEKDGIVLMNPGTPSLGKMASFGFVEHQDGSVGIKIYELTGRVLQEYNFRV
jgi:hypothetical protein